MYGLHKYVFVYFHVLCYYYYQLCVHGYLVINKQSIMFKPNEEDPLVEDNGADPYEIWLPLEEIVYSYITKEYSAPGSRTSRYRISGMGLQNIRNGTIVLHDQPFLLLTQKGFHARLEWAMIGNKGTSLTRIYMYMSSRR